MSSFGRTASPVLVIPPAPVHQMPLDRHLFALQSASLSHPAAWAKAIAGMPRGRKRSRDEAAVNLDPPEKTPPAVELAKEDEDEWEYGPGMILIKKSSGYIRDATNQSGTWLEEKKAEEDARKTEEAILAQQRQAQDRPSLRSHKSSRLDVSASLSPQESQVRTASPGRDLGDASTVDASAQPVVDDFTLHLGIGWSRLSDDEHIQAAARGWARYVENHYPISEPTILLKSKGLESYLVEAREGYFLFAEDLHQGRLVSSNPQRVLENLKSSPPVFDGPESMVAAESPRPLSEMDARSPTRQAATHTDVDMDMS